MKRSLLLLTAAAVALTPLAASAAPSPSKGGARTVTFDYSGFSSVDTPAVSFHTAAVCTVVDSCMTFETKKGEKTIEVADSAGGGIQVWVDGAYAENVVTFCGSGKITVPPKTSHEISVRPSAGACGVPTEGTLTAVIKNAKAK